MELVLYEYYIDSYNLTNHRIFLLACGCDQNGIENFGL